MEDGDHPLPEFDFRAAYARLKAAMTGGSQSMPFLAQKHEFSMRESGCSGRAFYPDGKTFARGCVRDGGEVRLRHALVHPGPLQGGGRGPGRRSCARPHPI